MKSFALLGWIGLVAAAPKAVQLGVEFDQGPDALPILKLGYSTYRAASYDKATDVYFWNNIRFAAPPVGPLRWQKPAPPLQDDKIQDGSVSGRCVEAPRKKKLNVTYTLAPVQEDCLFLDVSAPGKAIKNKDTSLPVIVWIYGGGYVSGFKEEYTHGHNVVAASGNNAIYVQGNYRMGAYGFMAGTVVEKEGIANAGFWDQHAVFEWVQKYISLVGGNPKSVAAWGQSAGAGSIMNTLIMKEGQQDPLFHRALMMSPAFYFEQDRKGKVTNQYKKFATLAGCEGKGLACLRALPAEALLNASNIINTGLPAGTYAFTPTPDKVNIVQLAQLEYSDDNYWKNLDSIISSHVINEASNFIDKSVTDDDKFNKFLEALTSSGNKGPPTAADKLMKQSVGKLINAVQKQYPAISTPEGQKTYATEQDRLNAFIRDASFTCNNRVLSDAFPGKTYSFKYSIMPGTHGSDVDPLFYNPRNFPNDDAANPDKGWALAYQSYFISHALTGDPNAKRLTDSTIPWGFSNSTGEKITGVLELVGGSGPSAFRIIEDDQALKTKCDFWHAVEKQLKLLSIA